MSQGGMEMTVTTYTQEKKKHALTMMAPAHNKPLSEIMKFSGISKMTLSLCHKQARKQGRTVPGTRKLQSNKATGKFSVVLETAPLNKAESRIQPR